MVTEPAAQMSFPESHRDNLLQSLLDELGKVADTESISLPKAFSKVALRWLGEDSESAERITDGAADRGLDAYRVNPESIVIYQFKGRETLDKEELMRPASVDFISDIPRVISLISGNGLVVSASSATKKFISQLRSYLRVYKDAESLRGVDLEEGNLNPPLITLKLAILSLGLTRQAREEFERIKDEYTVISAMGVEALLDIQLITIDDLLAQRWKETNTQWKDASGRRSDTIKLRVEGSKISDKSSMIFYTRAVDLINAFNNFGYQLFEPNVRCQITTSRVNREIGKQIETIKGIEKFKDLNNGVTLVYASYSERDKTVTLSKPGIVNGLQTVTTLAGKHENLPDEIREYFDANCNILVRLYSKAKVNVPTLVKATNNQNPMEPRNLRSNDPEQILLERRFAELGWFYERKDYAWEAFTSDETSWPSLQNFNRRSFQVHTGQGGRPAIRRIDNQDVAQAWLAFTGYANDAVQRKRDLFIDDRFYDHAFRARPAKHGSEYDFSFSEAKRNDDIATEAPLAEALILSSLCNQMSASLTPSGRKHRDASIARLNLAGQRREDQDIKLNDDAKYLAGLIRTSASMLFTEVCGLVLFRSFGERFYDEVPNLLTSTDIVDVYRYADYEKIRQKIGGDNPNPEDSDLFSILWLTYTYLTDSIAEDISWRNSFFQQSSRPRFLYSVDMRRRLSSYIHNFDNRLKGVGIPLTWTAPLEKKGGLFKYVESLRRV